MPPQDPNQPQQPTVNPDPAQAEAPQSIQSPVNPGQQSDTFAIISLILAFVFAPVGFVMSVITVVKAKTSLSKTLGIIGIVIGALGSLVFLGVLVGRVATTSVGIQQKARDSERTIDLKTLQSQLEAYYANKGQYPSNSDLGTNSNSNVSWIATNMPSMDKETLRDPQAALNDYSLVTSGDGTLHKYSYEPTNDSGSACDDTKTNACVHYQLIGVPEGSGADIQYRSLH